MNSQTSYFERYRLFAPIFVALMTACDAEYAPEASVAVSRSAITADAHDAAKIEWSECKGENLNKAGAVCGMLSVPLDHDEPHGTMIQLALSMIKHTVPDDQYQGIMLANPGGPGGSGLGMARLGKYIPNDAGLAYDWVGFDTRYSGACRSQPGFGTAARAIVQLGTILDCSVRRTARSALRWTSCVRMQLTAATCASLT